MRILKSKYYFILCLIISIASCNSQHNQITNPEQTPIGKSNYFDSILNNIQSKWQFIYRTNTELIKTDINGSNKQTLININQLVSSNKAHIISAVISTKGTKVLVYYSNSSDSNNYSIGKILIYDLKRNSYQFIPTNFNEYNLDWLVKPNWLDDDTFIISIIKWENYTSLTKIVKYNLGKIITHDIIELELENAILVWMEKTATLLMGSGKEHPPIKNIKALDINGIRIADLNEINYYKHPTELRANSTFVPLSSKCNFTMKIETVDENDEEDLKEYIYLNNKIVRCTDGQIENYPFWDNDLGVIIWYEYVGYSNYVNTYFMDNKGHYKYWFNGFLCGKILNKTK